MTKREKFKRQLEVFSYLNKEELKLPLYAYDRGYVDGLAEGAELRGKLVEALKDDVFDREHHEKTCPYNWEDTLHPIKRCNCYYKTLIALISEAKERAE